MRNVCGARLRRLHVREAVLTVGPPDPRARLRECGDGTRRPHRHRASPHPAVTLICRTRASGAFGRCTLSTPLCSFALMFAASIVSGTSNTRM